MKGEKTYAADVTVPKPLPAGAKIWIQGETDSGKARGSFEMESHNGHKH